jgi:transcriptional regulator with XRE-family HTH domain
MTQAEFARRVGVTQGHLSRLERGEKEAGAPVLLAISREFGKSVDWLLTGKADVEPKKRATERAGAVRARLSYSTTAIMSR